MGAELFDSRAETGVQLFDLAKGHAGCRDWFTNGEGNFTGIEVAGVDRKQIVNAAQGDGHERDLGADGEEGRSGQEGLRGAVGGAGALREDEQRHAGTESANGGSEAGDGGVGI